VALPDLSLNLVDSVDSASAFLRWLGERRPCLAVDTETTGLSWFDTTRLVQFGDGQGGWAVPLHSWRGVAEAGLQAVKDGGHPVILHNSSYDLHKLENDGLPIPAASQVEDTLILSRLKDPHLPAGLKALCARLYGREAVAGQELLSQRMRENKWTWATVPDTLPEYWAYGVLDTCLTALAFEHLRPLVPSQAYEREMAVLSVMYGAERRGLRIDVPYTENLLAEWTQEADELRSLLQAKGIQNPGSSHQVTLHLRSAGWEPSEFTDKGNVKLDKVVLNALREHYGDVAEPLIRYRRITDWCSTYLRPFLRERDDNDRVHANINTMGARTGRKSVTSPPLQTLPSKGSGGVIRNCILPYTDKEVIYSVDYAQMEPCITAHYSNDEALIAAICRGEDMYLYCATVIHGPDKAEELRPKYKVVLLSKLYGAGDEGIAAKLGVPVAEVTGLMNNLKARFPKLFLLMDSIEHQAKVRLAVEGRAYVTTSGGRQVVGDEDTLYALTNYLIQGSAADIMKDGIIAVACAGLSDNIMVPVHDEILFSFPKETAAAQAAIAQEAMQDLTGFKVPLRCDVTGPLSRWGEAYE